MVFRFYLLNGGFMAHCPLTANSKNKSSYFDATPKIIRRWDVFTELEESHGSGDENKDDAEHDILGKAGLGLRGFKGGHAREQRAHTTPTSLLIEGGVLLGRF